MRTTKVLLIVVALAGAHCAINYEPNPATSSPTRVDPSDTNDANHLVTTSAATTAAASPKGVTPSGIIIGNTPPGVATGADSNAPTSSGTPHNPNIISTTIPTPLPTPLPPPTQYTPVPWPNIGFVDYAGSRGQKVVALTFDDGPDGTGTGQNNTAAILDFLRDNNIKASFFVCGKVWTTVMDDVQAKIDMHRIVDEGHDIGSHTFTHPHLDTIPPATITTEFANNLAMARSILGDAFTFTTYRAPFGFPFQTGNPNVAWVAPAAAPNGVHVGWGIDTDDWKCGQNGQDSNCILTNLKAQLDAGHSGPILMHAVYQLTVKTLPNVVAMLKSYGYTLATVEELIKDKYGATSASIAQANTSAAFTDSAISAFAAAECKKNRIITVVY
jgi:peptidoglycan/xylan/chitin deacetylase (PgdA/CDA1 family)